MSKSNKEINIEFVEEVLNKKKIDKFNDYYSKDCVFHVSPYIGLGFNSGDNGEGKLIINSIAKGGPASSKLKVGDEIVAASTETRKLESFEDLEQGLSFITQGKKGIPIVLTIIRNGEKMDVEIVRDKIEGFDLTWDDVGDSFKHSVANDIQDGKTEILHIVEEGDMVCVYDRTSGTVADFNREAVWDTCRILKFKDGKIIESWSVGPNLSYYTQLGYKVEPPQA